jgi:anti-sigma factor RsiW
MTCERPQELFTAYLEGTLDPALRRAVEDHLAACPACEALMVTLRKVEETLADWPELEPSPALLARLNAIPTTRKKFRLVPDIFLRPSLQPFFAGAAGLLVFVSFLFLAPQGRSFQKAVNRQFHLGWSEAERIYAKAGSLTDRLGEYKNNLLGSLKVLNILKKSETEK